MYNINDILGEVGNFMADSEAEAAKMSQDCQRVLRMYNNADMDGACKQISDWIDIFKDSKATVSEYPSWLRKIVYNLIYQHLDQGTGAKYNQTELLQKMDLPKDVFKAKYWNMYSPDMKVRQSRYECLSLPLNYAEVECNDIHRAMVHYMICQADILTDTVVDLFGKAGLVPALCANGYSYRHVFASRDKYKELVLFQRALKKPIKLYKNIQKRQHYLSRASRKESIALISLDLALSQVRTRLWIHSLTVEQTKNDDLIIGGNKRGFDAWAAGYFFSLCFAPEYWLDSKRIVAKTTGGMVVTTWADASKVSQRQIDKFVNMTKEDFLKFADSYVKKVELVNVNAKKCIYDIRAENSYADWSGDWSHYKGTKDLLYIDVPKYIREEKRFSFYGEDHMALLDVLMGYEGNWILVWKMYVEKPADATRQEGRNHKGTHEAGVYEEIYKKPFLGEEEYGCVPGKHERTVALADLMNDLRMISSEYRKLKVFRYRDKNRNKPNSIVFITNIDISLPDAKAFQTKYQLKFENDGKLSVLSIEEFCKKYSMMFGPKGIFKNSL